MFSDDINHCQPITLTQSRFCTVSYCAHCQSYHLHVGPVSLHLNEAVFDNLCHELSRIYIEKHQPERRQGVSH